jgi:hypothetical protein
VQGAGAHTVNAGDGADIICGSTGNDTINGGVGNDSISGGAGNDVINGGTGNDTVAGGTGNDVISANAGNDVINGDAGNDSISGGAGNDSITSGKGNDAVSGDGGDDTLLGQSGNDSLTGGVGNDSLQGGIGKDVLTPGTGANICASDKGDQIIGSCTMDDSGPGVSGSMATSAVKAGSTVTFMWTISDVVGVSSTWVKISGPSGWVTTWCGFGLQGSRISGTAQSGAYAATCAVPADAVNTSYTAWFDASDLFGQSAASSTANFSVTGGANDSSAPVVSNIALSSPTLSLGQTLDITYDVQDDTGVQGVIAWVALDGYGFANNEGRSYVDYGLYNSRTSGDEKNGSYLQQITLNSFAPPGDYTLWITVIDKLGNKVFYQTSTTFTVFMRVD